MGVYSIKFDIILHNIFERLRISNFIKKKQN